MEPINLYSNKTKSRYLELIQVVRNNGAIENNFFDRCKNNDLSRLDLIQYLLNWYPITESFAINGLLYAHLVAKHLQRNVNSENFENIESFFCDVLEISKGEFEIINIAPNNFHPKAFTRLASKLGIKTIDLISRNCNLNSETKILEKNIVANFSNNDDILCGFANFFVVETIAYNIVLSMSNTFGKLQDEEGNRLYSDYELVYITEHLELEVKHGNEVAKMFEKLNLSKNDFLTLSTYVEELSFNFYKFWEALNNS